MISQISENLYLIRKIPFQENTQIVTLLSTDDHVIRAIYRPGVRKTGRLQPFQKFSAQIKTSKQNGLAKMSNIQSIQSQQMKGYELFAGLYLNELIEKILKIGPPISGIFDLYDQAIQQLTKKPLAIVLRWFELAFLEKLGYGIDTSYPDDHRVQCIDDQWVVSPNSGPYTIANIKSAMNQSLDAKHAKQLRDLTVPMLSSLMPDRTIHVLSMF